MGMRKGYAGLAALAMMASMSSQEQIMYREFEERERERDLNKIAAPKQIIPYVPKGSKEYFFNLQGEFSTKGMLKTDCVFKCVAINDKNAIKKFVKWKSNQNINT